MEELEIDILARMFDKPDALCNIDDEVKFQEAKIEIDPHAFKNPKYLEDMCEKIWNMVILPRKQANGAISLRNTTNGVGKNISK